MADDLKTPVEELARIAKLESWVLPGVLRRAGWAQGQLVTQSEFDAAVHTFLTGGTAGEVPPKIDKDAARAAKIAADKAAADAAAKAAANAGGNK
jgi:hypothetical protein